MTSVASQITERRNERERVDIDGGCVWEENERRCVVIIPPSIFALALSLRRYRDFSRSLLRWLIPTAGDPLFSLCSHNAVVGGSTPVGLSNEVLRRWGTHPPIERSSPSLGAEPPSAGV